MVTEKIISRKVLIFSSAIAVVAIVVWGIWSRSSVAADVARSTLRNTQLTVAAIPASAAPSNLDVVLPGTVQAAYETPIYARTSGYIKRWYTDIGTRVKAGTLLAEIDSPEVDQQLRQARADLAVAKANNVIAQATAKRIHALLPTQSVSAEQDDQATSDAAAKEATVAAADANVARLTELVRFERVTAPYDGIITARETDVGNLINAGSANGRELFRIADTSTLRIYVQVPQSYATVVGKGVTAALQFPEYPDRTFTAQFARTANAIDPVARTLLVQLELNNADDQILPGGYTDVHFKIPNPRRGVVIPANTLLFRSEGVRVASVSREGKVTLHAVSLGRDFGNLVEVTTGIEPGDYVVVNPPASLGDGEHVDVRMTKGTRS